MYMLFMLWSISAILTLKYVVIYMCCFDCDRACLFIFPFDFLMEQLRCSESVVAMFYKGLFYVFLDLAVLFYGFIHLARFCVWLRCVFDFNCYIYCLCQRDVTPICIRSCLFVLFMFCLELVTNI
jgi:hypothetical protein